MAAKRIESLDKMENLRPRSGAGGRRQTVSRNDAVSQRMSECESPSQVAKFAEENGISRDEVFERAEAAPNFGQFRMVLGNRIRGIQKKLADAKKKGKDLTPAQAAYPRAGAARRERGRATENGPKVLTVDEAKAHFEGVEPSFVKSAGDLRAARSIANKQPGSVIVKSSDGTKFEVYLDPRVKASAEKPAPASKAEAKPAKKAGKKVSKKTTKKAPSRRGQKAAKA